MFVSVFFQLEVKLFENIQLLLNCTFPHCIYNDVIKAVVFLLILPIFFTQVYKQCLVSIPLFFFLIVLDAHNNLSGDSVKCFGAAEQLHYDVSA